MLFSYSALHSCASPPPRPALVLCCFSFNLGQIGSRGHFLPSFSPSCVPAVPLALWQQDLVFIFSAGGDLTPLSEGCPPPFIQTATMKTERARVKMAVIKNGCLAVKRGGDVREMKTKTWTERGWAAGSSHRRALLSKQLCSQGGVTAGHSRITLLANKRELLARKAARDSRRL